MLWQVGFVFLVCFLGTGGEAVTRRPAKPLFMGSNPIPCSTSFEHIKSKAYRFHRLRIWGAHLRSTRAGSQASSSPDAALICNFRQFCSTGGASMSILDPA